MKPIRKVRANQYERPAGSPGERPPETLPRARVVANFGAALAVVDADSYAPIPRVRRAVALRRLPLLVAGDVVCCETSPEGDERAVWLEPRNSVIERADRRGQPRPLAANVTHLAIVSALQPGIDTLLIDQFVAAAEVARLGSIIVINKADRLTTGERAQIDELLDEYRKIGYPAVLVSSKTGHGLAPLTDVLQGCTVVLVGASGVGKSSIVQRLLPDRELRIGALSQATGFGAHTTTTSMWYALGDKAALIDSPGVRQFVVPGLSAEQVRQAYREIFEAGQACRFANCTHRAEPDCAVQAAVQNQAIAGWRFENYLRLLEN